MPLHICFVVLSVSVYLCLPVSPSLTRARDPFLTLFTALTSALLATSNVTASPRFGAPELKYTQLWSGVSPSCGDTHTTRSAR